MKKILFNFYICILIIVGMFYFLNLAFAYNQSAYNFIHNLHLGMRNNIDVINLQKFLKDQGFFNGPANGKFGPLTFSAVKKFQSSHKIKPTGIFGPASRTLANTLQQSTVTNSVPSVIPTTPPAAIPFSPSIIATTSFAILATSLPTAAQGIDYSASISIVNLPSSDISQQISGGSLPPGLSLRQNACVSAVNCQISANIFGTPTLAGSYTFIIIITSAGKSASQQFTITVAGPLSITTSYISSGVVGSAYSMSMSASGALGSYFWQVSSGSLPPGLSLIPGQCIASLCQNPAMLLGTTTLSGVYNFGVTVTSGTQSASQQFTITVNPAPSSLKISPATIPNFNIGQTAEVQGIYTPVSNCSVSTYSCSASGSSAIPINWTSSNTAVVTVSGKYYDSTTEIITAVGAGTATITGTYTLGNLTATMQVIVSGTIPAVFQISPISPTVAVGKTIYLQALYTPSYSCSSSSCFTSGSKIVSAFWTSSNTAVAMVASKSDPVTFIVDPLTEVVTGNSPGVTTINASYYSGMTIQASTGLIVAPAQ